MSPEGVKTRYYFVDEAGDPTLFNAGGRVIVGEDGCSSHFMLGALDVANPVALGMGLRSLHEQIKADPLYRGVESMRPERGKTHRLLHAKDDLPEIRDRVFRFLMTQDVRFYAVIRDKHGLAAHVRNLNQRGGPYRYNANTMYDEMVKRLFKDRLHKEDAYRVVFAARGSKDRTKALSQALQDARANFQRKWGSLHAHEAYELQAADYFLWALMRCFAKGEDRFIRALWTQVGLIHDVDDRRRSPYGCYYNAKYPITAELIQKEPGI
jgi:hypothetical protein